MRAHLIYASMIAFDDVDHCVALCPGFVKGGGGLSGGRKGKTITTAVFTDQLCRVKQLLVLVGFFPNQEGAHVGLWQEICPLIVSERPSVCQRESLG